MKFRKPMAFDGFTGNKVNQFTQIRLILQTKLADDPLPTNQTFEHFLQRSSNHSLTNQFLESQQYLIATSNITVSEFCNIAFSSGGIDC